MLPVPVNPAERPRHRVHLKRMLLSDSVDDLLPDWAYFVRGVGRHDRAAADGEPGGAVRRRAPRATRAALGEAVRRWIVRLGTTRPDRLAAFLDVHHLGVKALALHDDEMLALVHRWLPFETTVGPQHHRGGPARARRRPLRHLGGRVPSGRPGRHRARPGRRQRRLRLRRRPAQPHAAGARCRRRRSCSRPTCAPTSPRWSRRRPAPRRRLLEVAHDACSSRSAATSTIATFEPAGLPGLYLVDRAARQDAERSRSRERVDALWGAVLDSLDPATPRRPRPQLVLNHRHPLVRRLVGRADAPRTACALEALYGQALLQGRHPLRPVDQALLTRTMLELLDPDPDPTRDPGPREPGQEATR